MNCCSVLAEFLILSSPEENSDLAPVHEDEALGLMGDIGAHSAAHNAVPGRLIHRVEFSLDYFCNIVEHSLLLKSKANTVNCVLLHIWVHVCIFDDCILSVLLVNVTVGHYLLLIIFWHPVVFFECSCLGSLIGCH